MTKLIWSLCDLELMMNYVLWISSRPTSWHWLQSSGWPCHRHCIPARPMWHLDDPPWSWKQQWLRTTLVNHAGAKMSEAGFLQLLLWNLFFYSKVPELDFIMKRKVGTEKSHKATEDSSFTMTCLEGVREPIHLLQYAYSHKKKEEMLNVQNARRQKGEI